MSPVNQFTVWNPVCGCDSLTDFPASSTDILKKQESFSARADGTQPRHCFRAE